MIAILSIFKNTKTFLTVPQSIPANIGATAAPSPLKIWSSDGVET